MQIQWKDIPNYEGFYQVSNLGEVKRIVTYKGNPMSRALKPLDDGRGYMKVRLYKHGKSKFFRVHQIVLRTFVGDYPPGKEANHKDGDRSNNSLDNLEYVTKKENCLHMYHVLGRQRSNPKRTMLKLHQVKEIKALYDTGEYSQVDLGKRFDVNRNTIGNIVRGITWKHCK